MVAIEIYLATSCYFNTFLLYMYLPEIVVELFIRWNIFVFRWNKKLSIIQKLAMSQSIAESQSKQTQMQPWSSITMSQSLAHIYMTAASSFSVVYQIPLVGYFKKNRHVSSKATFNFQSSLFQQLLLPAWVRQVVIVVALWSELVEPLPSGPWSLKLLVSRIILLYY